MGGMDPRLGGYFYFRILIFETSVFTKHFGMSGFDVRVWELVCYCFIFIVGLLGNLTICLVVLKSGPSYTLLPFNVYLMSLAIADLVLAVVCLPVYVMSTSAYSHPDGTEGVILCKIITGYLLPFWLGGVSIYLLVIISFERYTAISKPFVAFTRTTSKKTVLLIAGAWFIGFIIQLPTVIGIDFTKGNSSIGNHCVYKWKSETQRTLIFVFAFTFQYIIPALIFIVNFYRIQQCLAKFDRDLKQRFSDSYKLINVDIKVMKKKRKTVRIVFVASLAFFICWTPNNIMYFLFQYAGRKDISWCNSGFQFGIILGFFNSCVNPFLYSFQSRDFRSHCKKILKKMFGINCDLSGTTMERGPRRDSAAALM